MSDGPVNWGLREIIFELVRCVTPRSALKWCAPDPRRHHIGDGFTLLPMKGQRVVLKSGINMRQSFRLMNKSEVGILVRLLRSSFV